LRFKIARKRNLAAVLRVGIPVTQSMRRLRHTLPALAALLLAGVAQSRPLLGTQPAPGKTPETLALRDAVDRALRSNLGLAITRDEIGKADAGIDMAQSAFDPVFSIGSGFNRFQSAGANYVQRGEVSNAWANNASVSQRFASGTRVSIFTGFDPNLTPIAIASPDIGTHTGIEVRQALTRGADESVNLAPIARARLNLERTKTNLRIAAVNLIRDTEIAYRNVAATRELLAIRESALVSAQSLLNEIRVRRRPEIGTATEQDELEAAAEAAAHRVDIANARGRFESAADSLRSLLGEAPAQDSAPRAPIVEKLEEHVPPAPEFPKFMTETAAFNPEAVLGEIDIRDANTAVDAAYDSTSPSLDFVVNASTLGRGDSAWHAIRGQWVDSGSNLNIGLELNIPLGMRESEAALRIARRSHQQALYRMADARRAAGYAARAAWRDLVNARERLTVAESGVAIQTRAYAGARARNARGLASVNDVLQAATRLDNARVSLLDAAYDHAVADAQRARLDGSILTRNGLRWEEVDERAATGTNHALEEENARR
ncbi:MAG: hypothetical protein RJA21_1225, partial [Gemmatimonadota bacterium]